MVSPSLFNDTQNAQNCAQGQIFNKIYIVINASKISKMINTFEKILSYLLIDLKLSLYFY